MAVGGTVRPLDDGKLRTVVVADEVRFPAVFESKFHTTQRRLSARPIPGTARTLERRAGGDIPDVRSAARWRVGVHRALPAFCHDAAYWAMDLLLGALEVKEHADGHEC